MNRLIITGDTHANFERFSSIDFPFKDLTKDDYVVICGDFGLIWDSKESKYEKYWKEWLSDKPWTTLFIPGNHENFDRLESDEFETKMWNGGIVKEITPSILYLPFGEIYNIGNQKVLALGKNYSHDIQHGIVDPANYETREEMKAACKAIERKCGGRQFAMYRIKGESWWEQEVPSKAERENALHNLSLVDNKVDIVLTHGLPATDLMLLYKRFGNPNEYEYWLENEIRSRVDYKYLFSGHYHIDKAASYKDICIYEKMIEVF